MPSKQVVCPLINEKVTVTRDCNTCKKNICNHFLLAIMDNCQNLDEIEKLNEKVLKSLNGRDCSIISNRLGTGAEAIASTNNFEFMYSQNANSKFGSILDIVSNHKRPVVVFTESDEANEFLEELKKLDIKKNIPIKLWELN